MPSKEGNRRAALIKAAALARVRPGADYDEGAITSDAAAEHLLDFMYRNGEFSLGLLQAASYLLSGTKREELETLDQVNRLAERALRIAPGNPDVLRRAFTIFQQLIPDPGRSENDIILTDTNWETLPERELLE